MVPVGHSPRLRGQSVKLIVRLHLQPLYVFTSEELKDYRE